MRFPPPIPMATQLSQERAFDQPSIPDRLYFKIGDVAKICEVQTSVLRFWETQFTQLNPNKSGTGQRLYRKRDVEVALAIKRLVHIDGYTLAGARQILDQGPRRPDAVREMPRNSQREALFDGQSLLPLAGEIPSQGPESIASTIGHARAELREIASLLATPVSHPQRRRSRLAAVPRPAQLLFPS